MATSSQPASQAQPGKKELRLVQSRFQVRDVSTQYDGPTFEIVFHDAENGVERYSEAIWSSAEEAALEAERLEDALLRPVHWDVSRGR